MNALILSTMLAGQCPGGVCPVQFAPLPRHLPAPQYVVAPTPVYSQGVYYQPVVYRTYGPVRGFFADRQPVRTLLRNGPIRNFLRRMIP